MSLLMELKQALSDYRKTQGEEPEILRMTQGAWDEIRRDPFVIKLISHVGRHGRTSLFGIGVEIVDDGPARFERKAENRFTQATYIRRDPIPVSISAPASEGLLQLDKLLADFHAAVWRAAAGEDGSVDYDMAGRAEAKAIQQHVRSMLAGGA